MRSRSRYSSMSRLTNFGGSNDRSAAIQHSQSSSDPFDGVVEGEGADVRADRRDLDRHVVDVGSTQSGDHHVEPPAGLILPDDRFAEHVDVAADAVGTSLGDVIGERRIGGGDDHRGRLVAESSRDERHHDSRCEPGDPSSDPEQRAIGRCQRAEVGFANQLGKSTGGGTRHGNPSHLVGQPEREVGCRLVTEQGPQPATSLPLATARRGVDGGGLVDQSASQIDRCLHTPFVAIGRFRCRPVHLLGRLSP